MPARDENDPEYSVMFFDTETVGSLDNMYEKGPNVEPYHPWTPLERQPHMIQLSFVVFHPKTYVIKDFYCGYVKLDNMELMTEEAFTHNHISRETCEKHGRPILEVLRRFYAAYSRADRLIAHNIKFDRKIILFECMRNRGDIRQHCPELGPLFKITKKPEAVEQYCTMWETTKFCKLVKKNGQTGKPPRLIELYRILFKDDPPEPLHNAVIDTLVGLRCYLKYAEEKTVHNVKFGHMIKQGFELAKLDPALLAANLCSLPYEGRAF